MKRYLLTTIILSMLLPLGASAQWYLFPGSPQARDSVKVQATQTDTVTTQTQTVVTETPVQENPSVEENVTEAGNEIDAENGIEDTSMYDITYVALILPIRSTGTPNSNFLDFYSGVLMAADGLSSDSHKYQINVFDSTVSLPSAADLERNDLVLGPVTCEDVEQLLPRSRGKYLISPLDPKVAAYTDRYNIIQAPSGWEYQVDDLVRWLAEDLRGGDAVVVLQSDQESGGEATERIVRRLGEMGIDYSISSEPASWEGKAKGSCRFIVASENDDFCTFAVREVALMNLRGSRNIVYSTSRLRGLPDLETESMHAAAAHITATYYADQSDPEVKRFATSYRELFKAEPGQWAFQGYDLMRYFGTMAAREPQLWQEELAATPGKGLQTDFRFDASGKINTAVRRLKYNTNNTISVIR